jgi:hypothetical protein
MSCKDMQDSLPRTTPTEQRVSHGVFGKLAGIFRMRILEHNRRAARQSDSSLAKIRSTIDEKAFPSCMKVTLPAPL